MPLAPNMGISSLIPWHGLHGLTSSSFGCRP
jgi:hypothetical protein